MGQEETLDSNQYMAFISYRHADNQEQDRQWATWLHQQLETYEIPADLIGTTNLRGEIIPEQIYPVFRDEVSLPASADLSSSITSALEESQFLIVLCSPNAVQSRYVAEEIHYFKRIGRQDRMMAAILVGEPNASIDAAKVQDPQDASTQECFPKPLQYHLDQQGELDLNSHAEPIAADFRLPNGQLGYTSPSIYRKTLEQQGLTKKETDKLVTSYEDTLNNAKLKIISGILGVRLEDLTQRDKHYQLIKAEAAAKRFRKIAVGMGTLALIAMIAGGIAYHQYEKASDLLTLASEQISFLNIEVRDALQDHAPGEVRIPIMRQLEDILNQLDTQGIEDNQDLTRQKAIALLQQADLVLQDASLDPAQAKPLYLESHQLSKQLTQLDPANTQYQRDLSVSYEKLGNLSLRLGDTVAAQRYYQDALMVRQKLTQLDPANTQFQRDLSISYNKLGDLSLRLSDTAAAQRYYQDALTVAEKLTELDPANTQYQRDLSISYNKLGNLSLRLGDTAAAQRYYQDALKGFEKLTQLDPSNTQYQRDLSVSYERLGNLSLRLSDTAAAQQYYQDALKGFEKLTQLDPANTQYQRDLWVSYNKLGDLSLRLSDTAAAQQYYQDGLTVAEKLTQLDPANTEYQRDLSISYEKLGNLSLRLSDTAAAQRYYQDALTVRQKLTQLDPANTQYQRDLSISYERLGDLSLRLSDTAAAQQYYQDGLTVAEKLTQLDPANTEYQRDLWVSHYKLGELYEKAGKLAAALKDYRKFVALAKQYGSKVLSKEDLAVVETVKAKIKKMAEDE